MLNVWILCVGNLKEPYFRQAQAEYEKRLGAYCRLRNAECREDAQLLPFLREHRGYKIALCVEGKQLSSEELAAKVEQVTNGGTGELILCIGGSDGLPEEVKAACDFRLSFSRMTFPHRLMRVILLEQLYRAFTILHHTPYHK